MAKDKRFKKVYSQDMGCIEILVDKQTGINYLTVPAAMAEV